MLSRCYNIFAIPFLFIAICFASSNAVHAKQQSGDSSSDKISAVKSSELGNAVNVHQVGDLFTSGQFDAKDIEALKANKIERVISLRTDGEIDWKEQAAVEAAGLKFINVPFRAPDEMTDELFANVRSLLRDKSTKTLFHCGSASRVGGVWLPYRVLDEGVELEVAVAEAKEIGLRSPGYQAKAIEYIERIQSIIAKGGEQSVKPGVNKNFLDPDLDVDQYVQRFEVESREVFLARKAVVAACGIEPGDLIADVGAGTGLYSRLFSEAVGANGWVYAVDISTRFLEHINSESDKLNVRNITGVLCAEDSVSLPPNCVDVVFICDTYHHFEFPKSTMKSIHRALKDD
ncbi:MAG: methyltransferase domain-containing protein, partial [Mariniblastus sp.]|nr:methyltransferase domain-containing protein [Mariniblastus sp.]